MRLLYRSKRISARNLRDRSKSINSILSPTWCRFKNLTPRSKTLRRICLIVRSMQGGLNSQVRTDSKMFDLRQLWSLIVPIMPLWGLLLRRAPCTRVLLLLVFSARLWVSHLEVRSHLSCQEFLTTHKSHIFLTMRFLSSYVSMKTLSSKLLYLKTFKKLRRANSRKKCFRKTNRFSNWPSKFVVITKRASCPRVWSNLKLRTHSWSLVVLRMPLGFKT